MPADHFKNIAHNDHQFRPKYPQLQFEIIADQAPSCEHARDCATGSGQAVLALAEIYETVTATDLSADQLQYSEYH